MGKKTQKIYFEESPVARRHPKTDLLILARLLKDEGTKQFQDEEHAAAAYQTLVRWADMEVSGKLAEFNETQLQGLFLADVFGQGLGYTLASEVADVWNLEQHYQIAPGQTPDAVLGKFQQGEPRSPLTVVELKGPKVHLDRDRSNGRTAIDQCWDYLVNTPTTCRWGIVSNIVSFRLYERDSTKQKYEHFALQDLRDWNVFRRFYVLFHRHGLVEGVAKEEVRAVRLLKATNNRQREVSEVLYKTYSESRVELIAHLHHELGHSVDDSIQFGQLLLDRIVFIAFCEDRGLLPFETIKKAYERIPAFSRVTNPRWQNFKDLFESIDKGHPGNNGDHREVIPAYNGGLFQKSPADDLELDDRWTNFFHWISEFSFADEVNLDVLGHLFERSITELEKLRFTGMLGDAEKAEQFARMPQSVKRKQLGVYYTPAELTSRIVSYTVGELIVERFADAAVKYGVKREAALRDILPEDEAFWRECLAILRDLKIVDPACGSGAFLFQAYNLLEARYQEVVGHLEDCGAKDSEALERQIPHFILNDNLYGVDLSREAVEITQLALWIRSATRDQTLATLSRNIVHGNSLVHDVNVHEDGFDWKERFPEVFERVPKNPLLAAGGSRRSNHEQPPATACGYEELQAGFDCVIGNPPWERIKLQEREFFSPPAPEIATSTNAAKRRKLVEKLEKQDPPLYERYQEALANADALLTYCRKSEEYPLTGRGDINLYAVFAELAYKIVAPEGRVGLLTPSGIASDNTTKDFFAAVAESNRLIRLFDFENKKIYFPEVHPSFKFCILNFGGSAVKQKSAKFTFFVHQIEELDDSTRQIALSGDDIRLLNPNTRTCPIFRTKRDAEITKAIYRRVPILIDQTREGPTGNPWGIKFKTMFHQTNDAELFREAEQLKGEGFKLKGNRWTKGKETYLPLYEAKMVQAYDHRAADVVTDTENWVRQGQTAKTSTVNWQNPEHLGTPRFWVAQQTAEAQVENVPNHFLAFKDVTSPTNQRTMIAAMLPFVGVVNSAPLVFTHQAVRRECCLLANLNSVAWDYIMRQKISNLHLNFFLVEQIPTLTPDTYAKKCPWKKSQTLETWISERVLKLTCTAEDMLPLAEACGFTAGSFKKEYGGRLNKWDEAERAALMAELDAAYFHLYGINREDAEYILGTFKGIDKQTPLFGEKQNMRERILAIYDEMM
ncbi:MAG: DNA methyltransferase [Bythopirellula sp.]|nr:DNA methyltransferase [Bythopirellula sp.]